MTKLIPNIQFDQSLYSVRCEVVVTECRGCGYIWFPLSAFHSEILDKSEEGEGFGKYERLLTRWVEVGKLLVNRLKKTKNV